MEKLGNGTFIRPVESNYTKTLHKFGKKSTFEEINFYDNFHCLALEKQTVTFQKPLHWGFCVLHCSRV